MMRKFFLGFLTVVIGVATSFAADPAPPAPPKDPVVVDAKTEAVIKGALKFLAGKQLPNGAITSSDEEQRHPTAITAYALMGFMAAGHLPGEGEHGRTVSLAMQYLLDSVQPDGIIGNRNNGQYMYGHGVASIALAELYRSNAVAEHAPEIGASNQIDYWIAK